LLLLLLRAELLLLLSKVELMPAATGEVPVSWRLAKPTAYTLQATIHNLLSQKTLAQQSEEDRKAPKLRVKVL
jgi:hypothetical protein